jgi:hypothetical protein
VSSENKHSENKENENKDRGNNRGNTSRKTTTDVSDGLAGLLEAHTSERRQLRKRRCHWDIVHEKTPRPPHH